LGEGTLGAYFSSKYETFSFGELKNCIEGKILRGFRRFI